MKKLLIAFVVVTVMIACKGNQNGTENSGTDTTSAGIQKADTVSTAGMQYTCPMHPGVVKDGPGTCDSCGMDLVPKS